MIDTIYAELTEICESCGKTDHYLNMTQTEGLNSDTYVCEQCWREN